MNSTPKKFRVLFLGTPDFAVEPLKALVESLEFEVVHVITQPDKPAGRGMKLQPSPVKTLALSHKIPVTTPLKVSALEELEFLKSLNLDVAVVVAFGQILSQKFLDLFEGRVVNVHSSLLPRWRGAAPMQRAIMSGDTETGVTLQKVVFKLDAGEVIAVHKTSLTDEVDFPAIYNVLKFLSRELVTKDLALFMKGLLNPTPQDDNQVTIAKKIRKEEGLINWQLPSVEIKNAVRGLWPWPGTWTHRQNQILKIRKVKLSNLSGEPGHVIDVSRESFVVACGQGALEVLEVQPESRSLQSSAEYLRGRPLLKGEVLGHEPTLK